MFQGSKCVDECTFLPRRNATTAISIITIIITDTGAGTDTSTGLRPGIGIDVSVSTPARGFTWYMCVSDCMAGLGTIAIESAPQQVPYLEFTHPEGAMPYAHTKFEFNAAENLAIAKVPRCQHV